MKLNVSGRLFDIAPYEVDRETSLIDMDEVERIAKERRPKLILAGWSAYPRRLDFAAFRRIADEVGAYLMVDMAHFAGLVAAGLHPSPVPYADMPAGKARRLLTDEMMDAIAVLSGQERADTYNELPPDSTGAAVGI